MQFATLSVLQHADTSSTTRVGLLEKPLMIHHYYYPFVSTTTLNKYMDIIFIQILCFSLFVIEQDYQIFWTYSGEILGVAMQTSCQPYEGPSSIKLQNKFEGTNSILTTSITHEFCNNSENNPYDYQLRIALNCSTECTTFISVIWYLKSEDNYSWFT